MGKIFTLLFIFAVSGVLAQDFLFSSDERVQIIQGDSSSGAPSIVGPTSSKNFVSISEPQSRRSPRLGEDSDQFAVSALRSTKWIKGGNGRRSVLYTPCFHNPCPGGVFFFCIESQCSYTIYLISQSGNVVQTIGSGNGSPKTWKFNTPCGKYRIKIVLNCECACAYVRFSMHQDRSDCFRCKDPIRHAYNPDTCQCECGNQCSCNKYQTWQNFPTCSCSCPNIQKCNNQTQYFDLKTCRCRALPRCKNCGCDFSDKLPRSSSADQFDVRDEDPNNGVVDIFSGGN